MTPHINARKEDIASIVIMPGDPLRAKWIAENFLKDYKLVNEVRGMLAYTGSRNGKRITVMGHGMGIPSVGIYTYELYKFYDVKTIIRVGSCGSYDSSINVGDVVIAKEAFSKSTYAHDIGVKCQEQVLFPTKSLLDKALATSHENNIITRSCRVNSEDAFYNKHSINELKSLSGALVVEMEAFALYANATLFDRQALTLLTCSDSLITNESLSPKDRQTTFKKMIELAFLIVK